MKKSFFALIMLLACSPAYSQIVRSTTFTKQAKEKSKIEWFARLGLSCNNLTGAAMKEAKSQIDENQRESDENENWSAKFGTRANYEIAGGFNKYFGKSNVYWGMELGLGSRGGSYTYKGKETHGDNNYETCDKAYVNSYNVKYTPFVVGYKYPVTDDIKVDAHLGIYLSYDFAGTYTEDEWNKVNGKIDEEYKDSWNFTDDYVEGYGFDCGLQLGIGVWYRKINLNFTWQRGFAPYIGGFPFGDNWYNKSGDQVYFNSSNAVISIAYAF